MDSKIYQLIELAEQEFKSYSENILRLTPLEIFKSSAETAAKENLLCSLIHDSYDFKDADLQPILEQEKPLDALYHFLLDGRSDLSSEDCISHILAEYNGSVQRADDALGMSKEVTMC